MKKGWQGYDVKDIKERTASKGWHEKEELPYHELALL